MALTHCKLKQKSRRSTLATNKMSPGDRQTTRDDNLSRNVTVLNLINHFFTLGVGLRNIFTRKPCYRKGDRAMRPIYGCFENFCGSLTMPTATFADMLNALFLIDPVNLHTKFEVYTFMDNTWIRQRWVLG